MIKEKQTVNRTGMVFNKSYGQHILINSHLLSEMVAKSAIRPTDVLLEIGREPATRRRCCCSGRRK